jgi:tetratricopeptide (TPR) repeat protein
LYKAYIYRELKDSMKSKGSFDNYFAKHADPTKISSKVALRAAEVVAKIPGMHNEAIAYINKSVALQPEAKLNAPAFTTAGEIYENVKDFKNAAAFYQKALSAMENPGARAFFNVGYAQYKDKDFTSSLKTFQESEVKFPTDLRTVLWCARNNAAIDSNMSAASAVPYYTKYITMGGADSIKNKAGLIDSYYYLSLYNNNTGNKAEALNYLQKLKWLDAANQRVAILENALNPKPVAPPKPVVAPKPTVPVKTVPAKPVPAKPAPAKPTAAKPAVPVKASSSTAKPVATTKPTVKKS